MQKFILPAVLTAALGFAFVPSQAHAGGFSISINPGVVYADPGYVYPPPVYATPGYYAPSYPYVVTPSYYPRHRDEWREHEWREHHERDEHHDWDRHDDRGHDRYHP